MTDGEDTIFSVGQFCKVKTVPEMDGRDGCPTTRTSLTPLNCAFKNVFNGGVAFISPQPKNTFQVGLATKVR